MLNVPTSPGEFLDKLTILELKSGRITDPAKLANVQTELTALRTARDESIRVTAELDKLVNELRAINGELWKIEDDIRDCERNKDFGAKFVELARAVYTTNDRRSAVKRQINELLGSALVEEKSYAKYE
jgi:hypothetical protein